MRHAKTIDRGIMNIENGDGEMESFIWRIIESDPGTLLWWSDGVANEWDEYYDTPYQAFTRLGMLTQAVASGDCFGCDPIWLRQQFVHSLMW